MTTIVSPQVDTSGNAPEGHDQAMIDKVDELEQHLQDLQEQDKPPKRKIAGKYDSYEELERAYIELEKKLGSRSQEKKQEPNADKNIDESEALKRVEEAGVDVDAMTQYYWQNGELSEEHYKTLEKIGIRREIVDAYIEGLEAKYQAELNNIISKVGGEEQFAAMKEWAAANMDPAEIERFNRAVASEDMTVVENAVLGLAFRYQQEAGRDPKLIGGGNAGESAFQSVAQLVEAMKDPRYEKDPAYRKQVEQRLARSNIM
ncbi:capsid assembly protein [Candidatus Saccharibacteria bacterium]|nr:capsid assembly protein [Candidatus Saccharibacteria bacterium]